jgi:REP element-mobilizing transposase RayT
MKYDPEIHHRRSIRLKGYDYLRAGAYYLTICTQNREYLLGEIVNDRLRLNDAGKMVSRWYGELENKFPDIQCDAFVCMPNHVHFIVVNVLCNGSKPLPQTNIFMV